MNEILVKEDTSTEIAIIEEPISQAQEDFDTARDQLIDLIAIGKEGLETTLDLVKGSESPRAIEVFATLLRTLSDMNMGLIDIHRKKDGALGINNQNGGNGIPTTDNSNNVTQNLFVGSTEDLARMLSEIEQAKTIKTIN